jgi:flagellar basal-body rod protein FlgG
MNTSFTIASTGVRAYQTKLDTIANNIANVETSGYKRREAAFTDNLAVSIQNQAEQQKELGRVSPPGIRTTFGSRIASTSMDTTQGAAKETNNTYDLMLIGNGYFQVRRTNGDTSEIMYTRSGAFQPTLAANGRLQLVSPQGDILLDQNGNPIELADGEEFQVLADGTIAGSNQRIAVATIDNPQLLKDEGGAFMLNGANATLTNASYEIKQGFIESSNVDLSQEMTDMLKTQRGYQANARALSYADQMMGIANGIIRS